MGQPHPGRAGLFRDHGRLLEGHVLVLPRLFRLVRLAVHALADQKVRAGGVFDDIVAGPGVRRIDQLQAPAGRPQDHVRCEKAFLRLDGLALLQAVPELQGDPLRLGPVRVEAAGPVQGKGVAVAGDVVVDPEGMDMKILVPGQGDLLLPLGQLEKLDLKGKLRGDHPQAVDYAGEPLGTHHQKRLRALRVSHGQQHTREARDMVRVIMGKKHDINGFGAPALSAEGHLGPLAAVHHDPLSVVTEHQGGQIAVGQGHHPACSEQTDIDHIFSKTFLTGCNSRTNLLTVKTPETFQDPHASLTPRVPADMSCFPTTCQHLPHRSRGASGKPPVCCGAFILHRGLVPTMKQVSFFCARIPHLKPRALCDEEIHPDQAFPSPAGLFHMMKPSSTGWS